MYCDKCLEIKTLIKLRKDILQSLNYKNNLATMAKKGNNPF